MASRKRPLHEPQPLLPSGPFARADGPVFFSPPAPLVTKLPAASSAAAPRPPLTAAPAAGSIRAFMTPDATSAVPAAVHRVRAEAALAPTAIAAHAASGPSGAHGSTADTAPGGSWVRCPLCAANVHSLQLDDHLDFQCRSSQPTPPTVPQPQEQPPDDRAQAGLGSGARADGAGGSQRSGGSGGASGLGRASTVGGASAQAGAAGASSAVEMAACPCCGLWLPLSEMGVHLDEECRAAHAETPATGARAGSASAGGASAGCAAGSGRALGAEPAAGVAAAPEWVACPCCGRTVSWPSLNQHLDSGCAHDEPTALAIAAPAAGAAAGADASAAVDSAADAAAAAADASAGSGAASAACGFGCAPAAPVAPGVGLLESELSCQICLCVYADPHSLPCQHTFCLECILTTMKERKVNECTRRARATHATHARPTQRPPAPRRAARSRADRRTLRAASRRRLAAIPLPRPALPRARVASPARAQPQALRDHRHLQLDPAAARGRGRRGGVRSLRAASGPERYAGRGWRARRAVAAGGGGCARRRAARTACRRMRGRIRAAGAPASKGSRHGARRRSPQRRKATRRGRECAR
jgi:hypothetical protein